MESDDDLRVGDDHTLVVLSWPGEMRRGLLSSRYPIDVRDLLCFTCEVCAKVCALASLCRLSSRRLRDIGLYTFSVR